MEFTTLGAFIMLGLSLIFAWLSFKYGGKENKKVEINTNYEIDYSFKEPEQFPYETRQEYLKRRMIYKSEYDIKQLKNKIDNCCSKLKRDEMQQQLYALLEQHEKLVKN